MNIDISKTITPDRILSPLNPAHMKQLYQELSIQAAQDLSLEPHILFDQLMVAERDHSSGIGESVAIPQLKIEGLDRHYVLFAGLKNPIDFETIDNKDVDLVFMLLSPADNVAAHLYALSRLTRLVKDVDFCMKLRSASNHDVISAIWSGHDITSLAA